MYDPAELVDVMARVFLPYHIRTCTLAIVSIFESYLDTTIARLVQKGLTQSPKNSYMRRIEWAFQYILHSSYGNQAILNRRADLCLDIDHARRVRNLWMHNNGNFTKRYKSDALQITGRQPILVPAYTQYARNPRRKAPFPIDTAFFESSTRSHIEALHHIHNMVQTRHFHQKRWYGYRSASKDIRWKRVLIGS